MLVPIRDEQLPNLMFEFPYLSKNPIWGLNRIHAQVRTWFLEDKIMATVDNLSGQEKNIN